MPNSTYNFPGRMASLMARYHKGMADDPYIDRLLNALEDVSDVMRILEDRVGSKTQLKFHTREAKLREARGAAIKQGHAATKRMRAIDGILAEIDSELTKYAERRYTSGGNRMPPTVAARIQRLYRKREKLEREQYGLRRAERAGETAAGDIIHTHYKKQCQAIRDRGGNDKRNGSGLSESASPGLSDDPI